MNGGGFQVPEGVTLSEPIVPLCKEVQVHIPNY